MRNCACTRSRLFEFKEECYVIRVKPDCKVMGKYHTDFDLFDGVWRRAYGFVPIEDIKRKEQILAAYNQTRKPETEVCRDERARRHIWSGRGFW